MKSKLEKICIILNMFPLIIAAFFNTECIVCWKISDYLSIVILIIAFIGFMIMFFSTQLRVGVGLEIFIICLLTLCGFLYRLLLVDYADAMPVKDFLITYESATLWAKNGYFLIEKARLDPNWGLWTYVLSLVLKIHSDVSVRAAQMFNIIISSVTIPIIYGIVKIVLNNCSPLIPHRKIAFLSAFIYSFLPSISLFTGVLIPQHLSTFTAALIIFLLMLAHSKALAHIANYKIYLIYVGAGILLGFLNWFTPHITMTIFISWIIVIAVCEIFPTLQKKQLNKVKIKHWLLILFIIIVTQHASTQSGFYLLSNVMEISKQDLQHSSIWEQIYVGLDVDNNGKMSNSTRALKLKLQQQYQGDNLATIWKQKTVQNIYRDVKNLPQFFWTKFKEEWMSEDGIIYESWSRDANLNEAKKKFYQDFMDYNIMQLRYTHTFSYEILLILCILGCTYMLKRGNGTLSLCMLVIWGVILINLIMEVHNTNKSIIYWALSVLAGIGGYMFYCLIQKVYIFLYGIINKFFTKQKGNS